MVWFRADLRTEDNVALRRASRDADRGVVGVFTICPKQWLEHDWACVKVDFILRNLQCLSEQLGRLNIPLLIVRASTFRGVPEALLKLARRHKCDGLYFNREYEVHEVRRDEAVAKRFARAGLAVHAFADQTILDPTAVWTSDGRFYTVFTPFRRAWIARCGEQGGVKLQPRPRRQSALACAPNPIPKSVEGFDLASAQPDLWPAGERYAARRLSAFVKKRLRAYEEMRDLPGTDGTSRLSPYLTMGVLSPRRCLQSAVQANGGKLDGGAAMPSCWISELIWREFYRHVLVGFPRVSKNRAFQLHTERVAWRYDEDQFRAWCEGRTGVPIVDAGMGQLAQTGWMHNRLRMITAMFLAKDLLIDWRWGERHFMRHLIDGDLASNNGGWQWAASTGTDAAPYFRIFNPYTQGRRFDPDGAYIRRFVPQLASVDARALHDPRRFTAAERAKVDYPPPIIDHARARQRAIKAFAKLREQRRLR